MKYPFTGLYYFCFELGKNLLRHHKNTFDFLFLKSKKGEIPAHWPAISFRKWDELRHPHLPGDLYHGTWQMTKIIPRRPIKFVLTIHDLNFLYTDKSPAKKKKLLAKIQKRIDRADAITVISDYVRNDVLKHLRTDGKPLYKIYNGVELKAFPDFDQPHYRPSRPFLFTLGTVLYKKHFHVLPRLLPGTDYELIIAGIQPDKDYVSQIMEEARQYGVDDRVKLIGPVSDEEKYWYLDRSEAFVFPSISEGFGLPPVEAMRLGKPVFLSTYTSLPEIGGSVAYYFQNFEPEHMRNVLKEGLEDYHSHHRRNEIIKWSQQFTWENATAHYARVYQDVLSGKTKQKESSGNRSHLPITAIIPTKNEESNIAAAIRSVEWADEILVIDSYSDDRTVEIARSLGARVLQRPFDNFSHQKNYAISQAKYDWIFVLDADERVPAALKNEILQLLQQSPEETAFWIPRINFVGQKRIRFSGWQNDKCIRLFHRGYARYNGRFVHEEIENDGSTGYLKHPLWHYTYKDYNHFAGKLDFYARLKAQEWFRKGRRYHFLDKHLNAFYRFFKHYILHFGFLDGAEGFSIARHYMEAARKRFDYLHEMEKKGKK